MNKEIEPREQQVVLTIINKIDATGSHIRTDVIGELDPATFIQAIAALLVQASSLNKEMFDTSIDFMRDTGYRKIVDAEVLKQKLEEAEDLQIKV